MKEKCEHTCGVDTSTDGDPALLLLLGETGNILNENVFLDSDEDIWFSSCEFQYCPRCGEKIKRDEHGIVIKD